MLLETVDCSSCGIAGGDGPADAVARKLAFQTDLVEADYVGFSAETVDEVLATIAASIGDIKAVADGVTEMDTVAETMRSYLEGVACSEFKIVLFDGGVEDAEDNGYTAFMVPADFDTTVELAAAGLQAATVGGQPSAGMRI